MNRILAAYLMIALIISAVCLAESNTVVVEFGEYTYAVPSEWVNEISNDGGYNYHYETGDPFSGIYMMTGVDSFSITPSTAEHLLDNFVEGFAGSDYCKSVEMTDAVSCAQLLGCPHRELKVDFDFEGIIVPMIYFVWTDYKNVYTVGVSNLADPESVETEIEAVLATIRSKGAADKANSRRNPACVGEPIEIKASREGLNYTMEIVVDEFFRGEKYDELMIDRYLHDPSADCEYVAVKVTVTFKSIDSINEMRLGTDDPEIRVDAISSFESYSASGARYDNVHYSVSGMKELSYVYEGASTTGYFQFEIAKDDPAPMLAYEPEYNQKVWVSLH